MPSSCDCGIPTPTENGRQIRFPGRFYNPTRQLWNVTTVTALVKGNMRMSDSIRQHCDRLRAAVEAKYREDLKEIDKLEAKLTGSSPSPPISPESGTGESRPPQSRSVSHSDQNGQHRSGSVVQRVLEAIKGESCGGMIGLTPFNPARLTTSTVLSVL